MISWLLGPARLLSLALLAAACAYAVPLRAQEAWEYSPYRVEVWIASDGALSSAAAERLAGELATLLRSREPAAWRVAVGPAPRSVDFASTARTRSMEASLDKVILIRLEPASAGWHLAAREFDLTLGAWGWPAVRPLPHRWGLAAAAADLTCEVFRPIVRVKDAAGESASVSPRAAGLILFPESPAALRTGELLQPVLARRDLRRGTSSAEVRPLPWTWLQADRAETGSLTQTCRLFTGLRAPLETRGRARVERLAVAARTLGPKSELLLRGAGENGKLLAGYEIRARVGENGEEQFEVLGRSDRRGAVRLVGGAEPLRALEVWHGDRRLAAFPLVVGHEASYVAILPSDEQRLAARRYAAGVEDRLVEAVARRALLAREIESQLENGNMSAARARFDEYRRLIDLPTLLRELDRREAAYPTADGAEQQQISQLFADLKQLARRHLDPQVDASLLRVMQGADADRTP